MSEQVFRRPQRPAAPAQQETPFAALGQASSHADAGLDELLDSIDAVLETNAEEYVRSFVQKGGQ